jgi:hypothetical protein
LVLATRCTTSILRQIQHHCRMFLDPTLPNMVIPLDSGSGSSSGERM